MPTFLALGFAYDVLGELQRDRSPGATIAVRMQTTTSNFQRLTAGFRLGEVGFHDRNHLAGYRRLREIEEFSEWGMPDGTVEFDVGFRGTPQKWLFRFHRTSAEPGRFDVVEWCNEWSVRRGEEQVHAEFHSSPDANRELLPRLHEWISQAPFAEWGLRPYSKGRIDPARRLQDDDDDKVKESLLYLKMKHDDAGFQPLVRALRRALPEFGTLDFIDEGGFNYRPAFQLGGSARLLTRSLIGSGTWAFLSILLAARLAHVGGAQTLTLDEPHLYLHPGLERLLIDELTDSQKWSGRPLQLLVATHSPAFVDAAWGTGGMHLLAWNDPRDSVTPIHIDEEGRRAFRGGLDAQLSDLVYADRLVLVEGPSDAAAVPVLLQSLLRPGGGLRVEALRESDALRQKDFVNALRTVARSYSAHAWQVRPVLMLDADKKVRLEAEWSKWDRADDPTKLFDVVWLGQEGNDFESCFCDASFLESYFANARGAQLDEHGKDTLNEVLSQLRVGTEIPVSAKGSTIVRKLHERFVDPEKLGMTKQDYTVRLARFFADRRGELIVKNVAHWLAPLFSRFGSAL